MADAKTRFEKFCASRQAPVQLEIAMADGFREDVPEQYRREYQRYLRRRVRPFGEQLIAREDVQMLEKLENLGWLTPELMDSFLHTAAQTHKNASLAWLLRRKQETYGYRKRDFSL